MNQHLDIVLSYYDLFLEATCSANMLLGIIYAGYKIICEIHEKLLALNSRKVSIA